MKSEKYSLILRDLKGNFFTKEKSASSFFLKHKNDSFEERMNLISFESASFTDQNRREGL